MKEILTIENIRFMFEYDEESGIIKWKNPLTTRTSKGDIVNNKDSKGYLRVNICGAGYVKAHRVAWMHFYGNALKSSEHIDHINGNRCDNRIANLRIASIKENLRNTKKHIDGNAPYKGITFNKKCNKWQAQISGGGKYKYIGLFADPKLAAIEYDSHAIEIYGEFARTNAMLGLLP